MELFYKKPSKVTQNMMSSVCKGFNDSDFHKIAEDKFCRLTNHDECKLVNSGNSAILLAMSNVKGSVIVPY